MTASKPKPYARVQLTAAALDDLDRVSARSVEALKQVFRELRRLDDGEITPVPLQDCAKTGDLSDCGKIVVEVDNEPECRIVVRDTGTGYDVIDVLVVELRDDDLAYLLAGLRLGRIGDPLRRSDAQRRIARIRQQHTPP